MIDPREIIAVVLVSIIAIAYRISKTKKKKDRPKGIKFVGDEQSHTRYQVAMVMLKHHPDLYDIVLNLREVRAGPHPETGISGVDRERRIFYWVMGTPASTAYDASTLIHEAFHCVQWRRDRNQPAGEREREAQDLQIKVAKRLGAKQPEIDYLRNCKWTEGRWIC